MRLTDRKSFYTSEKQSEHCQKKRRMASQADLSTVHRDQHLKVVHLQQCWQELKDRERRAQQHNRQLLLDFEKAQDSLREMVASTAAMKTIRSEYERYLEENAPRWLQQLKEQTQAAQIKRTEEYFKECLKNAGEEQVTTSSAEVHTSRSQGPSKKPQKAAASQENYNQNGHAHYSQDVSTSHPRTPSMHLWLTHTKSQIAGFPSRVPGQPQGCSLVPPSFHPSSIYPHPHPFQFHHLASSLSHCHPWSQQGLPGWTSHQTEYPWSWAASAPMHPSGPELSTREPAGWGTMQEVQTSTELNPKTERSRSSHSSSELDFKPVRLTTGHAGSSSRVSHQESREKRKRENRGRAQESSSDSESSRSQGTSSVNASASGAHGSESNTTSEKCCSSRRRSGRSALEPQRIEKPVNERIRSEGDVSGNQNEEDQSPENQSRANNLESYREEVGSQREEDSASASLKLEDGGSDEREEQESSTENSSAGEKHEEECYKNLGDGHDDGDVEEKENSQRDEEHKVGEEDDDDASSRKSTTEEEGETEEDERDEQSSVGPEDDEEQSSRENVKSENRKHSSESSQEEEVDENNSEGSEDKIENEEESDEEEESRLEEEQQRNPEAGKPEESDSDDIIISPQENRSKKMHIIPEEDEVAEEDGREGSETGDFDDSNEFSDKDVIELLLAPQVHTQKKEEKYMKDDNKPEGMLTVIISR
ncbi:hypothetical protein LDENG_00054640 [Lucifuga dentata]|nr:hypothetical protein LDENG_00054640 [Lucifuga dentata]